MTAALAERATVGALASRLPAPAGSGESPEFRRLQGAALVADVRGSTAWGAALAARHGPRGSDVLAAAMSEALGAAADVVFGEGGLVVDIVGDAIHAVWLEEGSGEAAERAALRAGRAARRLARSAGELPLRVGVAEGTVDAAVVGGLNGRWDIVVWGGALQAAATGEEAEAAPRRPPSAQDNAPASALDPALLLHGALRDVEGEAALAWTDELRVVSVLFCRLAPPSPILEPLPLHRAVRRLQEVAAAHGGEFDKATADEKGVFGVLVFGPEVSPAPARAAAAARALLQAMPTTQLGIAGGKVFMGMVGGRRRAQYTLCGPAANLAARLMGAASAGEALCDVATRDALGGVAVSARAPVQLKGLGEVAAFRLSSSEDARSELSAPASTARIVGRDDELAVLTAFANGRSRGRRMLLCGEPGLGKTTLLAATVEAARQAGRPRLCIAGAPPASRDALSAWTGRARALLHERAEACRTGDAAAFDDLVEEAGLDCDLAVLGLRLFRLPGLETVATARLSAEDRRREARRIQAALLRTLAGPGPLLVVDDADRVDEASLALADEVLHQDPRARLVQTQRRAPDPASDTDPEREVVTLAPLAPLAIAQLMREVAPVRDDHPAVVWLHGRAKGNPQLAGELLRVLAGRDLAGALASPGAWDEAAAGLGLETMPLTIEAAVMGRIAQKDRATQAVLKAASVAGRRFDARTLAGLGAPASEVVIAGALDALVQEAILVRDDGHYSFPQDLTRAALHGALPDSLRQDLHRRAAERLEAARQFDRAGEIGRHWSEARRPRRAGRWLRQAARAAASAGASNDAAALLRECLALDGGLGGGLEALRRARLYGDLAAALCRLNKRDAAIAAGRRALAILGEAPPRAKRGWVRFGAWQGLRLAAAVGRLSHRRNARRRRYAAAVRVGAAYNLSDMLYFTHGTAAAAAMSLSAVAAAERVGRPADAAHAYAMLGYAAGLLRIRRLSRWLLARPETDAEAGRPTHFVAGCRLWLAVLFGRWAEVEAARAELEQLQRRAPDSYALRIATALFAQDAWLRGEVGQARRQVEVLAAEAQAAGDDEHLAWSEVYAVRDRLWAGDLDEAQVRLDYAARLQVRGGDRQVGAIIAAQSAALAARRGDLDAMERAAEAGLALARNRAAWPNGTHDALAGLAEAMLALHQRSPCRRSRRRLRDALALAVAYGRLFPMGRAPAALQVGAAAAAQGRWTRAAAVWRKGVELAGRQGLPLERARLLQALSSCPKASAAERAALAAEAQAIAAACGTRLPPHVLQTCA